jgi:hypothetical protein
MHRANMIVPPFFELYLVKDLYPSLVPILKKVLYLKKDRKKQPHGRGCFFSNGFYIARRNNKITIGKSGPKSHQYPMIRPTITIKPTTPRMVFFLLRASCSPLLVENDLTPELT